LTTTNDDWKQIPQAPMYDVSSRGQVRSWVVRRGIRTLRGERAETPRILEPRGTGSGQVDLYVAPGECIRASVSVLRRAAFPEVES
jgi:hypothetical protein